MNDKDNSKKLYTQLWVWFVVAFLLNLILLFTIIYFSELSHQWNQQPQKPPLGTTQPPRVMKIYKHKQMNAPKGTANTPQPAVKQKQPPKTPPKQQEAQDPDPKIKEAETEKKNIIKKETTKETKQAVAHAPKKPPQKTKRKRYYEPKQELHPNTPSLADIATGFLDHQKQQDRQTVGITNGNINGDLAMMKYASYFKTLKKHMQTALNIFINRLSGPERKMLTEKRLPQTVFDLEWDKNGNIILQRLAQSSGSPAHDTMSEEILKSALPLPAIPPSLNINTLAHPWAFGLTPGHMSDMNAVPSSFNYT